MSNPFEWREIATAQMQYGTTRTVDEVIAEHRASHERANRTTAKGTAAPELGTVRKSELSKLHEMLASAKPRPAPVDE